MAVFITKDKKELMVTCECGCHDSVHIKIEGGDDDDYALMTYLNGNWYRDQNDRLLRSIGRKLKKIWKILTNKDHYYSDILMTKADFEAFKEYINSFE